MMEKEYPRVHLGKGSKDITNKRFGKLLALYRTENKIQPNGTTKSMWVCECDCGSTKPIMYSSLHAGYSVSCGKCKSKGEVPFSVLSIEGVTYGCEVEAGYGNHKHGQSTKRIFHIWCGMLYRCYNSNSKAYPYYGGKGIRVCDRWLNMSNFIQDNEHLCGDGLSIDRIDCDKGYCPENTRWIPLNKQTQNTSPKHWDTVKYKGVCWSKSKLRYRTNCYFKGKQTHLGFFDCPVEAALCYDDFVSKNKSFNWLNRDHFPEVMEKYSCQE